MSLKNLTDLRYNAVGGIDALFNGFPYSLSLLEIAHAEQGTFGIVSDKSEETLTLENSLERDKERTWRDSQLAMSDIELYKVQDGDGIGLVSDWRDYRKALRAWPESINFPNEDYRPVFNNND